MGEPGGRERILVVDDFRTNIEYIASILEESYEVLTAPGGEEALKAAREGRPDLILLDVMMPGLDGCQVCRLLKADPRTLDIPVVFVTALGEVEDEKRAFEAGGADFLTKPVNPVVVLARVRTQLALRGQMKRLEAMVDARTAELRRTRLDIIGMFGMAAEFRDNETGLHVIRMSEYAKVIALALGLGEGQADLILHAAPMHDIGKIGVPDAILLKQARLDPEETAVMRRHCEIGATILARHGEEPLATASVCALSHHERWDGQGYPRGLAGEDIPLIGRIAAVADVFDALTSRRPYKEPWPVGKAAAELRDGSGSPFDPAVVEAFARALPAILEIRDRRQEERTP